MYICIGKIRFLYNYDGGEKGRQKIIMHGVCEVLIIHTVKSRPARRRDYN